MSELTVKRMNAAIRKSGIDVLSFESVTRDEQLAFLAGMKAGAKTSHPARHDSLPAGVDLAWAEAWDDGHDCHAQAINAAIKRLKREAK